MATQILPDIKEPEDFVKTEERQDENNSVTNEINNFVKNIFIDEDHDEVNLWLDKSDPTNREDEVYAYAYETSIRSRIGTFTADTILDENLNWSAEPVPDTYSITPLSERRLHIDNRMENYNDGLDYDPDVSVWTDDGATNTKLRENEIVYMNAGAKLEKITQTLDMIENDFEISTRSHFLITSLRGLTKDLQSIINERTRKINRLEAQCEKQEAVISSHRDENEYVLEKIDHAMKELENTITEQYKKIDQLDKNSVAQHMLVENHKKERIQLISKMQSMEQSLVASKNEKDSLCEKVATLENKHIVNKENKELLLERILHLQMDIERQKSDKELLLERIVNLEVELDDLMNNHKEEKDNLVERINELEVLLHDAEACGKNNCMLSHDFKKKIQIANLDLGKYNDSENRNNRTIAIETAQSGKYASKGVAINVIHNMLHKDKLAKLI